MKTLDPIGLAAQLLSLYPMRSKRRVPKIAIFGTALALLFCASAPPTSSATVQSDEADKREIIQNDPHPHLFDTKRILTDRQATAQLALPAKDEAFTFAVFGDRTGGPAAGVKVLAQAVGDVNLLEPDLVMTVGDLVQGYNQTPQWLNQMTEFKGIMDQLLMPWFPVAGNHDIYWRGQGPKPKGEHEANYEMHFGPLWYAFEHKNNWFIVLFSDEGNPKTGRKVFNQPASQTMSVAQFNWLSETLKNTADADNVFLFLHHPRWLKGGYGDDWDRVHKLLADAGNVKAVFAGHIHRMRYDGSKDGIEYVTLATVGGAQSAVAPTAGYLHQYHLVTVRKNQIALASIPVGEVMDVRKLTGTVSAEAATAARLRPRIKPNLRLDNSGAVDQSLTALINNPTTQPIEINYQLESADSRWQFTPAHAHQIIQPGESFDFEFQATRIGGSLDRTFRPAQLALKMDYLAGGLRYPLPDSTTTIITKPDLMAPAIATTELVANFNGKNDAFKVESRLINLPDDSPLTLECWFKADSYGERTGLVGKTESSDYGFFVNNGIPAFYIHIGDSYLNTVADAPLLKTNRWHHLAGVYDGAESRLYLDGQLIKSATRRGKRKRNNLPLYVGADVANNGTPTSFFDGQIDSVRLSKIARYQGPEFTPQRRAKTDPDTLLLLNMDGIVGPWLYDESGKAAHPTLIGDPKLIKE